MSFDFPERLLAKRSALSAYLLPAKPSRPLRRSDGEPRYAAAISELSSALASRIPKSNVVAVAIGISQLDPNDMTPTLQVFVRTEIGRAVEPSAERIPKTIDGTPVTIIKTGTLVRFAVSTRAVVRPVVPGISVGPALTDCAGTLGGTLIDDKKKRYILSNNHVLADENRLPKGSEIYQPSVRDGGSSANRIGQLSAWIDLQSSGADNLVDCALASLDETIKSTNALAGEPTLSGSVMPDLGRPVFKYGRSTGKTTGRITSVNADAVIGDYRNGPMRFINLFAVTREDGLAFSEAGDSGSIIRDCTTGAAIGLLIGGSGQLTVACNIGTVLDLLRDRLKVVGLDFA